METSRYALDYADPFAWIAIPGHATIVSEALRTADPAPPSATGLTADLFYLHPTTYPGPAWNQQFDRDSPSNSAKPTDDVAIRHLDPFAGSCRLFAPRYGQASGRAFREPGPDAEAARDLAFSDTKRAFRHYLRHQRNGRPFVLFGHSQGALHVSRLLAEVVEPDGLQPDLVAAYAIGIGISEGLFGPFYRTLAPCQTPAQTGCVISWNSFLADADATPFLARTAARDAPRLRSRNAGLPICINPLSFDTRITAVDAAANPGSLVGDTGVPPLPPLQPGLFGAESRGGILHIAPAPEPWHGLVPLGDGTMHMHDIALFHRALGIDVVRRMESHTRPGTS